MKPLVAVIALTIYVLLASACGDGGEPLTERLVGDWASGNHILRFTSDGTYVIDDTGLLETTPDDTGTVAFEGKTLTFTSGEDSRQCKAGGLWVWEGVEFLGEDQFFGVVMVDDCGNGEGREWTFTRCVAEPPPPAGRIVCEPVRSR